MPIPISTGSGAASVASELVGGSHYQQVEIRGLGGGSTLGINPDGTFNASIIGTPVVTLGSTSVLAIQSGTRITSIVSALPSSVIVGASIFGLPPVNVTNTNLNIGGSVLSYQTIPSSMLVGASIFGQLPAGTAPLGSVAALQGTNPWITTFSNSSVLSVPVGSTITVIQAASIAGTYAEDAAHSPGDRGILMFGVRRDTLASITSATDDYSPLAVGPSGAATVHDAPITRWVQGTGDLRVVQGASVTVIAAQGASVFTYLREVQLANMGSASVLVTIGGGLGSILGYTIAPAGGGSNFITRIKTGANSALTASISGTASVLVSYQGFTADI